MERIRLSDSFGYRRLLRFVAPPVIMMVFTSVYSIVDGFFVSNFTGELPFAALNLIYPFIMILGSVGFMLGTGGNAVVSKALGEGDKERANRIFSMLVYATLVVGMLLSVVGISVLRPVAKLFAKTEKTLSPSDRALLIDDCVLYGRIILLALPAFMLQNAFQGFFVTAEKARLGLFVILGAGFGNILFDALFVAVFDWGLAGAAYATALSQCIGGVLPVLYFARKNDSLLRLGKTKFEGKVFAGVCLNGFSELTTNVSMSVVSVVYNAQLMKYIGIDGVSAYGIMMYVGYIFAAVFIGYSVGVAPIVGYHYGAENRKELKNLFRKSLVLTCIAAVIMTAISIIFSGELSAVFVRKDTELWKLTSRGFRIYALNFLICGLNIFASAFFTALSNGVLSLVISVFRTFLCQIVSVLVLPHLWNLGVDGIWAASIAAEGIALLLSIFLLAKNSKRYGYA